MAEITQTSEFRELIRIADKDIDGKTSLFIALTKVKGIDFMMANAVCHVLSLNRKEQCGNLTQQRVEQIEEVMEHPEKFGIPAWMFNHRKDLETGLDKHLVASTLKLQQEMDIKFLKKIKNYRGIRHAKGSKKVRGQHTRSTGRRGSTLGVIRKKEAPKSTAKPAGKDGKK